MQTNILAEFGDDWVKTMAAGVFTSQLLTTYDGQIVMTIAHHQLKITKRNNSKMRKCRVIVLVHCTTQ